MQVFAGKKNNLTAPISNITFNDNWSPRLGINVDPFGDRKGKVFFNWGRYTQSLPSDAAIRELNQESASLLGQLCSSV